MSEIRHNPITGDPVILSTSRAGRPGAWSDDASRGDRHDCPFCPGNEHETPPEIGRIGGERWTARAVPNKYPALFEPSSPRHEVIIDAREHGLAFEAFGSERLRVAIDFWKERAISQGVAPERRHVSVFRNEGRGSGQSIPHPHCQILALDFVPRRIERELEAFRTRPCPLCATIVAEIRSGEVMIDRSGSLVLFAPRASRMPFETWIASERHESDWTTVASADLARLLLSAAGRLRAVHPDAPFNLSLISAPLRTEGAERFHWYAEITPRLTNLAGFELSTGGWINIEAPERAAECLRTAGPLRKD